MLGSVKYTPRSQQVFKLAWAEAQAFDHPCVSSQHLLLGLLKLGTGVQFSVLTKLGFTADSVRQSVGQINPEIARLYKKIGDIPFGASAQQALKRMRQEAVAMNHSYMGTEHLLLGLLAEENGGAASLFAAQKVDTKKTREEILIACSPH
jgi:ATP-dependent Clp protease ATP-binding subunit ClpC